MATLYITELNLMAVDFLNRNMPIPQDLVIAEQTVAIGGTSTASAALNSATTLVRLHCDIPCSVAFGKTPVATTTNRRMPGDAVEFWGVQPNQSYKYAVIAN